VIETDSERLHARKRDRDARRAATRKENVIETPGDDAV
jgi:hypothetical protein